MTKHLRLIMLSLLAMICMGGYSQSETDFTTVSWKSPYTFGKYTMTAVIGNGQTNPIQSKNDKDIRCYAKNKLTVSTKDGKMVKIVFVLSEQGKKQCSQPTVDNGTVKRNPADETQGVSEVIWENSNGSSSVTFTIGSKADWGTEKSKAGQLCFDKIVITDASSKTPTTVTFKGLTGTGVNLINGKLDGIDFTGYTAVVADKVAGKIAYTAAGDGVATVDEKTGAVTVYPNVFGTTTITATFTPKETEKYAKSSASYTVINKDPDAVEFVAGIQTSNDNILENNGVTINNSNGRFYENDGYRFYKGTTLRFSVQQGIITKIEMEGKGGAYPLTGINLTKGGGEVSKTPKTMKWTGLANVVQFSTSAQARAATIRVTVKPHYTLDETVDNVIEAKENVYVTLKRTFFHDNAWNTLCLPFDVADASAAFGGAEIREIDLSKCTDNTIQFVPATEIKAGVPYIIKWNENVADAQTFEKTFERVTLVAEPKPVKVNNDITFTGFYKMTAANDLGGTSVAAIGAGSKLFTVGEGKMKGFRAAFVLSSNAQASKYKVVIDGTATGIEDLVIDSAKANGRVYNLNGQYVGNSLNGLQPGLYIQNGKKIVVK